MSAVLPPEACDAHDLTIQFATQFPRAQPVETGDYVTVAHGAVVHRSKIENIPIIGVGAIVFEGSIIGMTPTMLENSKIPKRSIVVGVPAKIMKNVDNITYSRTKRRALWYYDVAKSYNGTLF